MQETQTKCITPNCPNMSYYSRCLSCSALEVSRKALEATQGTCTHNHSITGDFGLVMRLLPEYTGGHSQPGYMLDICHLIIKTAGPMLGRIETEKNTTPRAGA